MKIEVLSNPEAVAQKAAALVAAEARAAVSARGVFVMAVSGGRTCGPPRINQVLKAERNSL